MILKIMSYYKILMILKNRLTKEKKATIVMKFKSNFILTPDGLNMLLFSIAA